MRLQVNSDADDYRLGHLFLTGTLEQSILSLFIPKPYVIQLLALYNLIFIKKYHAGLNALRNPSE